MIRSIQGLAFEDPAKSDLSLSGQWLRRHWLTIFLAVLMLGLGLLLLGLALDLHVWDMKDLRLFLTLPLGLWILYYYVRLIRACWQHPLRALAQDPVRRFVTGEIVSVEWTADNFGWGRHPQATLRYQDAQGQAWQFTEDFSAGAWYGFAGAGDLKEPVPVWIVCGDQAGGLAAFVGLQKDWWEAKSAKMPKLTFLKAVLLILVAGVLMVGILTLMYHWGWLQ